MSLFKFLFGQSRPKDVGRVIVRSNILSSIGYDQESKVLQLEFLNGRVYEIQNFDEKLFEKMIDDREPDHFYPLLDATNMEFVGQEYPLWR